ncbi:MAG: LamG domain-containing protein [Pirellulales bacterium]|nr:LamG domain-containing protein [Pirellulales bacterium]
MNDNSSDHSEIQRLLCGLADGSLTEEQFQSLERLLANDRAARDEYRRYLELHAMLHFEHGLLPAAASSDPRVNPLAPEFADICQLDARTVPHMRPQSLGRVLPRSNVSWKWLACLIMLAALVGAAGMEAWHHRGFAWNVSKEGQSPDASHTPNTPVAMLASSNGCNWSGVTPVQMVVGAGVEVGDELALYEGIAEFRLANGVALSIEGPTALVLTSPQSLVLQHGKLTAHVPWSVGEFRIRSSCCQVAASDGELGIKIGGNSVEVHAFSGNALVSPLPEDDPGIEEAEVSDNLLESYCQENQLPKGSELSRVVVSMGRALRVSYDDRSSRVRDWSPARESGFSARLSMAGPLPVTGDYASAVRQSQPITYWRFESIDGEVVPNEMGTHHALSIRGAVQLAGSQDNWSIELGRPGQHGYAICKDSLEFGGNGDYSVELWAKPSHVHRAGMVSLVEEILDRKRKDAFSLETLAVNFKIHDKKYSQRFRYLHSTPPGKKVPETSNCIAKVLYQPRRWHHVVAVKEGSEMRLFVDGALTATQTDPTRFQGPLNVVVGTRMLERAKDSPSDFVTFVGQLDELAIYDRALGAQEVAGHYKQVKWNEEHVELRTHKRMASHRSSGPLAVVPLAGP